MKRRAFTLLETMIVLAIMAVFFAVSVPFFSGFTERTKLETSARSIVSVLRTARAYAIANNADYYAVCDTSTVPESYYVSADSVNAVDKKNKLPAGISFDIVGFTKGTAGTSAAFKATGELDEIAKETFVIIKDKEGNTKTIKVERTTGRARID